MKKNSIIAGLLALLTGCSSVEVAEYANKTPKMDIREYFNGDVDAWGVFIGRSGKVERSFSVAMNGQWQGDSGVLKEHFIYDDGKTQDREWKLTFTGANTFEGTAADIIGGAKGEQAGNAVNMKYVLRLPVNGTQYDLSMDDWIYRMTDDTAINRVQMTKFGVKVGELVITFRKKSAAKQN